MREHAYLKDQNIRKGVEKNFGDFLNAELQPIHRMTKYDLEKERCCC